MIKSLSVANLGPFYGQQTANFGEGVLSIEGRYSDKPGESNRAGKSALIDLLRFGFYGVHRHRTIPKYLNRKADPRNDPVYVSVEVENPDGMVFHIIREFDYSTQRFVLSVPEVEETAQMKQAEMQAYIETMLLGCDYTNAIRTWLVLQDDAKGIMNLSVVDRKRFLMDLFSPQSYPWDSYYTEASHRYTICRTRSSEIQSRINNLRNRLAELSGQDFNKELKQAKQKVNDIQARLDEVTSLEKDLVAISSPEALDELRARVKAANQKATDMHASLLLSRKTLDKLKRDVDNFNAKQKALADLYEQKKKLEKRAEKLKVKETEKEYADIYDAHRAIATTLSMDIQRYRAAEKFAGVCPVTKEECPSGMDVRAYKKELEASIEKATAEVDAYQKQLDKLVAVMDTNDRIIRDLGVVDSNIVAVERSLTNLDDVDQLYDQHKEQNKKDEQEYLDYKVEVDKLNAELAARRDDHDRTYQKRLRELAQEKRNLKEQLGDAETRVTVLIADQQRKDILERDFADAQREMKGIELREQALRSLKPMLSPDGVPFLHLLSSISEFEHQINQALSDLGTDLSIDVEPYTITNSLSPICSVCGYEYAKTSRVKKCPVVSCNAPREHKRKETLDIRLKGRLFDVDFDEDSGGGQQWVSMGVRFALFNILRERGLMGNIDFWSLDEVFAPLSDVSKFNMLSFLENICTTYNIKQMFLITHTDISAVVPPAVIIERSEAKQESIILT